MGWSIIEKGGPGRIPTYRKFIVDLITDLATLPTIPEVPAGSVAYCSENHSTYILELDGDWALKEGVPDIGLENLDDVDISEPSDGDAIIYDSTTEKWVNKPPSTDSGDVLNIKFIMDENQDVQVVEGSYDALCEAIDTETSYFNKFINTQVMGINTGACFNLFVSDIEFFFDDAPNDDKLVFQFMLWAIEVCVVNFVILSFNSEGVTFLPL